MLPVAPMAVTVIAFELVSSVMLAVPLVLFAAFDRHPVPTNVMHAQMGPPPHRQAPTPKVPSLAAH